MQKIITGIVFAALTSGVALAQQQTPPSTGPIITPSTPSPVANSPRDTSMGKMTMKHQTKAGMKKHVKMK